MRRTVLFAIVFWYMIVPASAQDRESAYSERLARAYPDFILGIRNNKVLWKDGTVTVFDDGKADKDWLTLLRSPDLEDQMHQTYPMDYPTDFRPKKNLSPGRIRWQPFFKKMYGETRGKIEVNLVSIRWLPTLQNVMIKVTRINGVDKKLAAVSAELEKLPAKYHKFLKDIGGAYSYRMIKDSDRLSMHSFGIAIDLNTRLTEYWKWKHDNELDDITYCNSVPYEIVRIFERHGFIWGGKWYHYDTMHFEYRPELLSNLND